jgi:two-component system, LuxR family, sensor kinase FixL
MLRSERLLHMGELTASLAHELNQPLTSILSNTRAALRFIESDRIDIGELKEILQDIANDDKRAGNIIRSLRAIVKPEEGTRELIAINDVLHEVSALFNSEAIIRRIRVVADLADSLPLVSVDKVQLQQVLINLMMNAADSMQDLAKEKKIVLQTRPTDDGGVLVSVTDSGVGIDEQELTRIFEPFFSTKRSGLGVGLSLSHSIIESHGGHIWAANNTDGGATFSFDLPGIKTE